MEMLHACHDKVRHFAQLTARLATHVAQHGADRQAQDAAQSVLRYFDLAAPLHHEDEEADLFPALRALGDRELNARIDALEAEHAELAAVWQTTRSWLTRIHAGEAEPPPVEANHFAQAYPAHADREEQDIYPHANRLPAPLLREIGTKMAQRRHIN